MTNPAAPTPATGLPVSPAAPLLSPERAQLLAGWLQQRDAEATAARERLQGNYRRAPWRKITSAAENRMRTRTARQQHADMLAELQRGPDDAIPDADDGAAWAGVLR